MLIYEKDNKLNINFENTVDGEPDVQIGKDEVKIGEATISDSNVLPVPEEGDSGKVPIVQSDGSYALGNAGGGGSAPLVVTFSGTTTGGDAACDKTWAEVDAANWLLVRWADANHNYYEGLTFKDARNDSRGPAIYVDAILKATHPSAVALTITVISIVMNEDGVSIELTNDELTIGTT